MSRRLGVIESINSTLSECKNIKELRHIGQTMSLSGVVCTCAEQDKEIYKTYLALERAATEFKRYLYAQLLDETEIALQMSE